VTPEEVSSLFKVLGGFGAGAVAAGVIAFLWVKYFFSSYLGEKGKNLATREDIEEITDKIEGVRLQYTSLSEELKARHQLRLAALDKRLEVHQQAFVLWRKLLSVTHSDEVGTTVIECQSWWEQNCIYLEAPVRESFVRAYSAAHMHNGLIRGRAEAKLIQENWKEITDFANHLFAAVQLPALSELEAKSIGAEPEAGQKDC